ARAVLEVHDADCHPSGLLRVEHSPQLGLAGEGPALLHCSLAAAYDLHSLPPLSALARSSLTARVVDLDPVRSPAGLGTKSQQAFRLRRAEERYVTAESLAHRRRWIVPADQLPRRRG